MKRMLIIPALFFMGLSSALAQKISSITPVTMSATAPSVTLHLQPIDTKIAVRDTAVFSLSVELGDTTVCWSVAQINIERILLHGAKFLTATSMVGTVEVDSSDASFVFKTPSIRSGEAVKIFFLADSASGKTEVEWSEFGAGFTGPDGCRIVISGITAETVPVEIFEARFEVKIGMGYSLVSLPVHASIAVPHGVVAWTFNGSVDTQVDTMSGGKGYFVWNPFSNTRTVTVFGRKIDTVRASLLAGWGCIAAPWDSADVRNALVTPAGGIALVVLSIDSATGEAIFGTEVVPGKAYVVWARVSASLTLAGSDTAKASLSSALGQDLHKFSHLLPPVFRKALTAALAKAGNGDPDAAVPRGFMLEQNYPNPFNPPTNIEYQLPKPGRVRLTIYNTLGQKVIRLVNDFREAGHHTVLWNGRDQHGTQAPSGVYHYRLEADDFVSTKKMVLAK